jgi:hypothetical protein
MKMKNGAKDCPAKLSAPSSESTFNFEMMNTFRKLVVSCKVDGEIDETLRRTKASPKMPCKNC